jgi:hypothetical protein
LRFIVADNPSIYFVTSLNNVFEKTSKTLSKKLATGAKPKSKFGGPVNVQRGKIGKIRSSNDQGYTAIGKREPARIIKKTITKKK